MTHSGQNSALSVLRRHDASKEFYESRYASGYMESDDWSAAKLSRVEQLIASLPLPKTGRVLDYGCGTGVFTAVLKRSLPGWDVVGTDISEAALQRARLRLPNCQFPSLSACEGLEHDFDLIFSHHVLEHVADISATARSLARLLKSTGSMFHILPCGNAGGLAYGVSSRVRNGISAESEGRFFFEEEGHLRRLTSEQLENLWKADGLRIRQAYFAEQVFGAVSSLTQFDLGLVRAFADHTLALNPRAKLELWMLRVALMGVWAARKPIAVVRNKRTAGCKNLRDVILFSGGMLIYPLSKAFDWTVRALAEWEWSQRNGDGGASEMYVYLTHDPVGRADLRQPAGHS